ncbi:PAS domain-containing protein [Pedobacter sp.]|uniref:PAS domain-containing sensor histidine kinase n=1 Tax=Pedobacter sp. TaxID=1411316 RepID=UPI0031E3B287
MEKSKGLEFADGELDQILIDDFEVDSVLFSKIADAIPDMLCVTDIQQMRKIYSNAHVHHLFKMSKQEINDMGLRFFEKTIHPADQYNYFKEIDNLRAVKNEHISEFKYRIIDHEGRIRWLATKRKVLKRDEHGLPLQIIGISQDITQQIELTEERQRLIDEQAKLKVLQQQQLFEAIINAQEDERRNIAENLHNEIGQLLFAAQLKLSSSETESRTLLNAAIKKVREISFELTPVLLNDMGLEVALKDMLEKKLDAHQISFNFSFNVKAPRINNNIEVIIYRILQELINNTVKHATANHVNVLVLQKGDELYISQTDNGTGLDKSILNDSKKGFGIKSIINRLHILNGVFEVFSSPESGTKVLMNIPLNSAK